MSSAIATVACQANAKARMAGKMLYQVDRADQRRSSLFTNCFILLFQLIKQVLDLSGTPLPSGFIP